MKKKARISINTRNKETNYTVDLEIKGNKIYYEEILDHQVTNVLYDKKEHILIRDNRDIYMEYNFFTGDASYYLKEFQKEFNLDLRVKNISSDDDKIEIVFMLENDLFKYIIDMGDKNE